MYDDRQKVDSHRAPPCRDGLHIALATPARGLGLFFIALCIHLLFKQDYTYSKVFIAPCTKKLFVYLKWCLLMAVS